MPQLDFDRARGELLRQIEVPELADIRTRARTIRQRRRTAAVASAALACLAVLGTGTALIADAVGRAPAPVAESPDPLPGGLVWRGGGLTLHGLNGPVLDQPGTLRDIQFADTDRGYALTARCGADNCTVALATTSDGGRTWANWPVPLDAAPAARLPALVPVGSGGLVLAGESAWFGSYGQSWQARGVDAPPTVSAVSDGSRLWLRQAPGSGCTASPVEVWRPDGTLARLVGQPQLDVCWVAPAPAADGAWWVGGAQGGVPAVAVSRNAGQSWTVASLPPAIAGAWAQVSTVGGEVYASVVSPRGGNPYPETLAIQAVYRSMAGGPFSQYTRRPGTLVGDVVALLDGRLVAAGPNWYVSAGAGANLAPAGGSMPPMYRIQRTPGGWVVYDLFQAGWAATSRDGATWQKINVR